MIARWQMLRRLLSGFERLIAASISIAVAQTLLLTPIALLVRHVFNDEIPSGDAGALLWLGLAIIVLYACSAALGLWTRYLSLRATKQAVTQLRIRLLERLYAMPRAWFDRTDLGTLHGTVVQDTERLDVLANTLIAQILPASTIALGLGVLLIVLDPLLFALLVAVIPILMAVSYWLGGAVRRRTRTYVGEFDRFTTQTLLALRAMTLTKLHAADRIEVERRSVELQALGAKGLEMVWFQGAYTLVNGTVGALAGVVVLIVGGGAVANGSMELGDLLSFFAALGLMRGQVMMVLAGAPIVISGFESLPRLERILDADEHEPYDGTEPHELVGELALERVEFGYGERSVLRDASISVSPGERVALVGENGAGKTTVVSLLLGLYRPRSGRVTVDGRPMADLDLHDVRRRIGVVPQDPLLFPGSVRENIAYGRPEASLAEVERAAREAGVDEFVALMDDGYESRIGDDGVLLSGGQRQRIAIARALVGDPAVLVLDEPTTHLDRASVRRLAASFANHRERALIIVSHDETIDDAVDRVYELADGHVRERQGQPFEVGDPLT